MGGWRMCHPQFLAKAFFSFRDEAWFTNWASVDGKLSILDPPEVLKLSESGYPPSLAPAGASPFELVVNYAWWILRSAMAWGLIKGSNTDWAYKRVKESTTIPANAKFGKMDSYWPVSPFRLGDLDDMLTPSSGPSNAFAHDMLLTTVWHACKDASGAEAAVQAGVAP